MRVFLFESLFGVTLLWVGIFWFVYLSNVLHAVWCNRLDPVEARAKAILTANFSLALLALWVHWILAVLVFINAFFMYFWAQRFFARRY